jgi:hypothetical protein
MFADLAGAGICHRSRPRFSLCLRSGFILLKLDRRLIELGLFLFRLFIRD